MGNFDINNIHKERLCIDPERSVLLGKYKILSKNQSCALIDRPRDCAIVDLPYAHHREGLMHIFHKDGDRRRGGNPLNRKPKGAKGITKSENEESPEAKVETHPKVNHEGL